MAHVAGFGSLVEQLSDFVLIGGIDNSAGLADQPYMDNTLLLPDLPDHLEDPEQVVLQHLVMGAADDGFRKAVAVRYRLFDNELLEVVEVQLSKYDHADKQDDACGNGDFCNEAEIHQRSLKSDKF
ncbi:hypothetical protein [Geobacter sp. OR-1]|uniref:hypothetical protein n=1 Tax=Geobacter sp. OR-1 TaxID=1266765 RepID=UPI001ED9BEDE|nr:hypothetical protein [Geobacter sp. OR-1]